MTQPMMYGQEVWKEENMFQENAKMKAEQEYQQQQKANGSGRGVEYGDMCGTGAAIGGLADMNRAQVAEKEELAIHRLMRQKRNIESEHRKLDRALGILERHPEFEELVELIRSGLV